MEHTHKNRVEPCIELSGVLAYQERELLSNPKHLQLIPAQTQSREHPNNSKLKKDLEGNGIQNIHHVCVGQSLFLAQENKVLK